MAIATEVLAELSDSKTPGMESIQPPHFSEVLPKRLWIADQTAGTNKFTLQLLSITHVICIGRPRYHAFCPDLPTSHVQFIIPMDLASLHHAVFDDIITSIKEILTKDPRSQILVHCESGIDLGVAIAIACLMGAEGFTFEKAHEEVQQRTTVSLHSDLWRVMNLWWDLETTRPFFPVGRGYRSIKWEVERAENSHPAKYPFDC